VSTFNEYNQNMDEIILKKDKEKEKFKDDRSLVVSE